MASIVDYNYNDHILIQHFKPQKIHMQILHTYLHTFLLRIFERIWFEIKALSLW